MALTMEQLAIMIQNSQMSIERKLDTSLAKIQDLLDIAAASEIKITTLESKVHNCESKLEDLTKNNDFLLKELESKNVVLGGVEDLANEVNKGNNKLENKDLENITEGHALMNAVILNNIAQHLNFRDILRFRLVCCRWEKVSKPLFWKLSRIKVANLAGFPSLARFENRNGRGIGEVEEENKDLIRRFEETFPSKEIPTNAIIFKGFITRATVDYFWLDRGSTTLREIYFRVFYEPSKTCIDLDHPLTSNLTTLVIDLQLDFTKFKISLKTVPNIQKLYLYDCEIHLNGRISPKELSITGCGSSVSYEGRTFKLMEDYGIGQQKILINDFVDFSKIKKLHLRGSILRLDVGKGAVDLEELGINKTELSGLTYTQWTANSLELRFATCIGNKMKIKSVVNNADLLNLPTCIEKLEISDIRQTAAPQILMYPKLRVCVLRSLEFQLLDFTNCTSLKDFTINSDKVYKMDFNKLLLPSSIKRVKMKNVDVTTDAPWKLNVLILDKYSFSSAKCILRHINTVKLKLEFKTAVDLEVDKASILRFWKMSNLQQFAFGPIEWTEKYPFWNSEFFNCVDKEGCYFLFTKRKNRKGKAIDSDTFSYYI